MVTTDAAGPEAAQQHQQQQAHPQQPTVAAVVCSGASSVVASASSAAGAALSLLSSSVASVSSAGAALWPAGHPPASAASTDAHLAVAREYSDDGHGDALMHTATAGAADGPVPVVAPSAFASPSKSAQAQSSSSAMNFDGAPVYNYPHSRTSIAAVTIASVAMQSVHPLAAAETYSAMSISDICSSSSPTTTAQTHPDISAFQSYSTDEDIQAAVEALGGLRNARPESVATSNRSYHQHLLVQTLQQDHQLRYFNHHKHQNSSGRSSSNHSISSSSSSSSTHHSHYEPHHHRQSIDNLSSSFVQKISLHSAELCQDLHGAPNDSFQHEHQHMQSQSLLHSQIQAQAPMPQQAFLQRVSNIIPLVNRSINQISSVYEATKNANTVVKYSAESVESGVKTITKPVFDTLEPALAPLDRFACNQLDRLERSVPYIFGASTAPNTSFSTSSDAAAKPPLVPPSSFRAMPATATVPVPLSNAMYAHDTISSRSRSNSIASSVDVLAPPSIPFHNDLASPHSPSIGLYSPNSPSFSESQYSNGTLHRGSIDDRPGSTVPHVERKSRSRWHQVVAGVGANLGMITDDTMRALRYCLQYLQFAISNIDHQINILRQYLVSAGGSVAQLVSGLGPNQPTPPISPRSSAAAAAAAKHASSSASKSTSTAMVIMPAGNLLEILTAVRREIVETLRKAVDIVGRYAAFCLPGDARQSVRGFILNLPSRMAVLSQPSIPPQPSSSHKSSRSMSDTMDVSMDAAHAPSSTFSASPTSFAGSSLSDAPDSPEAAEAKKVLALATESSAMLKGIESVFSRTVSVSERMLGHHHQQMHTGTSNGVSDPSALSAMDSFIPSHVGASNTNSSHAGSAAMLGSISNNSSTTLLAGSGTGSSSSVRRRRVRTSSSRSGKSANLNAAAAAVAAGMLPAGSVAAAAAAASASAFTTPNAFTGNADEDMMDVRSETAPSATSDAFDEDRLSNQASTPTYISAAVDMDMNIAF